MQIKITKDIVAGLHDDKSLEGVRIETLRGDVNFTIIILEEVAVEDLDFKKVRDLVAECLTVDETVVLNGEPYLK